MGARRVPRVQPLPRVAGVGAAPGGKDNTMHIMS